MTMKPMHKYLSFLMVTLLYASPCLANMKVTLTTGKQTSGQDESSSLKQAAQESEPEDSSLKRLVGKILPTFILNSLIHNLIDKCSSDDDSNSYGKQLSYIGGSFVAGSLVEAGWHWYDEKDKKTMCNLALKSGLKCAQPGIAQLAADVSADQVQDMRNKILIYNGVKFIVYTSTAAILHGGNTTKALLYHAAKQGAKDVIVDETLNAAIICAEIFNDDDETINGQQKIVAALKENPGIICQVIQWMWRKGGNIDDDE